MLLSGGKSCMPSVFLHAHVIHMAGSIKSLHTRTIQEVEKDP